MRPNRPAGKINIALYSLHQ